MKILILVLILMITSLTFGQTKQEKFKLHKNPKDLKQEIIKRIPIGTRLEEARRIMEANDFYCVWKQASSFVAGTEGKPEKEISNIDFLFCRKTKNLFWDLLTVFPKTLVYTRLWEVALIVKDGVVANTLVYIGWYCEL